MSSTTEPSAAAREAVARLLETQGGKIYALGRRLCGNDTEAEELVQDTFLEALRSYDAFRGGSKESTWLYTIAARACQRRRKRRATRAGVGPTPDVPLEQLAPFDEPGIVGLDPAGAAEDHELQDRLRDAIVDLPDEFRYAVVLRDIAGLSGPDAAAVLGVEPGTIKSRTHRARLMLRKAMLHGVPRRPASEPNYDARVCLDLLAAKLHALDRDAQEDARTAALIRQGELCDRCRDVFATLDTTRQLCEHLGEGEMPEAVRTRIETILASHAAGR